MPISKKMIHSVLSAIINDLNNFLRRTVGEAEDKAVLSAIVDQSGNLAFTGENKVLASVINVEHEKVGLNRRGHGMGRSNAPYDLNLYVLLACYFPGNYDEALKFLSLTIAFFQGKQAYTASNTPALPSGVDRLTLELYGTDMNEQSRLWGALGAKLMPSIAIKIRMVSISREQILEIIPEVRSVETSTLS